MVQLFQKSALQVPTVAEELSSLNIAAQGTIALLRQQTRLFAREVSTAQVRVTESSNVRTAPIVHWDQLSPFHAQEEHSDLVQLKISTSKHLVSLAAEVNI